MFKCNHGLLIAVLFSSMSAGSANAAVGIIGEGRISGDRIGGGKATSTHFRATDALANHFSFNDLSGEREDVSTGGLSKKIEFGDQPISKAEQIQMPRALHSETLPAPGSGALQNADNLFQINKKGIGNTWAEPATLSTAPSSERETWTMIFVGTMLIAYQLRRKQRGLMTLKPMPATLST